MSELDLTLKVEEVNSEEKKYQELIKRMKDKKRLKDPQPREDSDNSSLNYDSSRVSFISNFNILDSFNPNAVETKLIVKHPPKFSPLKAHKKHRKKSK